MSTEIASRITLELHESRARTLALLDPIPEPLLLAQHSPLMSPLVWDLAHIGHYEELWLLRELGLGTPTEPRFDDIYDAFRHPRAERPTLDILNPSEARAYLADVRRRVLHSLHDAYLDSGDPLLADGFVYGMVVHHEHQHDETMLATIQLMDEFAHPEAGDGSAAPGPDPAGLAPDVLVEAGPFAMGTSTDWWAYDNERPEHIVDLPAYRIDTTPVTNEAYLEFIEVGGYDDQKWWTDEGWAWRNEAGLEHPQFWIPGSYGWTRQRFGRIEQLPGREPVQHVCWYEADAYARWRGARLPTEAEWEKAASWDHWAGTHATRSEPWAQPATPSLGALYRHDHRWGPDEVGAHPSGASPYGCLDMLGGVWEWTASDFAAYPGFRSFPYREYSEVFFGPEYKVLRGGSWATDPIACSVTFRNWDFPIRRQIFAGFRCATDA